MNRKAVQLWERRDHDGALREFRQLALRTRTAVAWVDYAKALALTWQGCRAAEAFGTARRVGPAAAVDQAAANCLLGMRRYDLALEFLERVRAAGQAQAPHIAGLVVALDRAGRTDEAQEMLTEGLQRFGPLPELQLLRAKLMSRRAENAEESLTALELLLERGASDDSMASAVHYARAACCQKLGRFAEVFPALRLAKQPLLAAHRATLEQSTRSLDGLLEQVRTLTRENLRSWRERQGSSAQSLGLITGFPRSGTTLLEVILGSHERVVVSSEAPVFSDFIIAPQWDSHRAGPPDWSEPPQSKRLAERYWRLHEGNVGPLGDRVLIDKNPALTPLLGHFLNVLPEGRVLFCLREPKDVLLSCFMQELPVNNVSVHFLEWGQSWHCFSRCMEIWLRLRDLLDEGFLEIRYERLVADHGEVAREVLDFLGLPESPQVADYRLRAAERGVYSPTYAEVREPVQAGAVGRWTRHPEQFGIPDGVPLDSPLGRELGY
ncbi:sulfotransferase [Luteolibacter arcticus]|uniref:Sulfotransferase n=1 Tax=Luteolibacter arcticus TaxID=1581411 RepID=A0ABT3GMT4_9BACT|nr:sulfotransferase [Luteolibacter arcticus]MCW1924813.1 sulfotransferase [Luteolibacter arcticus]